MDAADYAPGEGVWSHVAAPATVDWCEPNYLLTPWVAEPYNTISSLWMVVLGVWGIAFVGGRRRFRILFGGLALVGVGSAAFHGTLLRPSQALDEVPMVLLGLVAVWAVTLRGRDFHEGRAMAAVMAVFALGFVGSYALAPAAFALFIAVYGTLVATLVIQSVRRTFGAAGDARLRRLFVVGTGAFLGTLAMCWVPEHVLLGCDHPLQQVPLHAIWHLGAGTGTYAFILWAMHDDARARRP